ncbi:hypothetical protein FA15DRAFT_657481 [Coprinopsis marcescibilis]|uniref:Uncharacterized protein n=1 Tax=Coprinopsis marcescibilis TaxID=230819 RepID=A0A5C3KPQ2_COPMA|nr:hypothetical protein FA15DRAFT_657481 [Coprinopsis marcescibilis]
MLVQFIYCVWLLSAATSTLAEIYVSLFEANKEKEGWHFGLVIHGEEDIVNKIPNELYEAVIDGGIESKTVGYMVYGGAREKNGKVVKVALKLTNVPYTFYLPNYTKDDVIDAMQQFEPSRIPGPQEKDGHFFNCFDFTKQTIDIIKPFIQQGDTDLKMFEDYYRANKGKVRRITDEGSRERAEEARKEAEKYRRDVEEAAELAKKEEVIKAEVETKTEEVASKVDQHPFTDEL